MAQDRCRTWQSEVTEENPDMRAARFLVAITAFGALIATMGTSGYQPPTTVQVLWQFEAGG
jgi:hypothetical protein